MQMKTFKFNASLLLASVLVGLSPCTTYAANSSNCAGKPVVEIVVFSANKGVSDSAINRAASDVLPALRKMPGFKDRAFSKSSSGKWIDVVQWQSLDSANAAAEKMMKNEKAVVFFALINQNDMKIEHLCE